MGEIIKLSVETIDSYGVYQFDANYINWLVGNEFGITVDFGKEDLDLSVKARLEPYFRDREVFVIEMLETWGAGGGVHCHTNDQPAVFKASH